MLGVDFLIARKMLRKCIMPNVNTVTICKSKNCMLRLLYIDLNVPKVENSEIISFSSYNYCLCNKGQNSMIL